MPKANIIKAIVLGLLSSLFLSSGLIVNSLNAYHGGSWAWTASLRFLLLLPVLVIMVAMRGKLRMLLQRMKQIPGTFLLWGNLGFGCYYALLSYAIQFAPGWLVTAGFMTTVFAGILLAPIVYQDHRARISRKGFVLSFFLVVSLITMQFDRISGLQHVGTLVFSIALAIIAAFLWPLGNRMLLVKLEKEKIELDPMQRVLGMTIGSLPLVSALAIYGYYTSGVPSALQFQSSFIAVIFSGVIGSTLFFKAMQLVSKHQLALLSVEATQVTGVFFTLVGEIVIKGIHWPGFYGNLGFGIMIVALGLYIRLSIKHRPLAIN